MLKEEVDEEDIAEVVSRWTGIPVAKMLEGEVDRLIPWRSSWRKRVIGQDAGHPGGVGRRPPVAGGHPGPGPADRLVHLPGAHRRRQDRAGPGAGRVPLRRREGHGPAGHVGVHGKARRRPAHRRAPGYVGYEEGGQLTEAVKRRPYAIVLFDEIEKAHPDVFNVLLQILDDGRLTDGQGRTVDFKNTLVIMTSNLGSQAIKESAATTRPWSGRCARSSKGTSSPSSSTGSTRSSSSGP